MDFLERILARVQRIIENADDIFFESVEQIQDNIFKVLRETIDKFSVRGILTKDEDSIKTLNKLRGDMLTAINDSKLPSKVDTFIGNFETLDGLNEDTHKILNDINIKGLDFKGVQKIETDKVVEGLTSPYGVTSGMLKDIQRSVYSDIMRGESRAKSVDNLEQLVKGENNPIEKHIKDVSANTMAQYDGAVQAIIKDEYNLTAQRYIGSIIKTSRNQCVRWVNSFDGIIADQVLEEEIAWALVNGGGYGSGLVPTVANFAVIRGGWNCRHRVIPFRATEEEIKASIKASQDKAIIRAKDVFTKNTLEDQLKKLAKNT